MVPLPLTREVLYNESRILMKTKKQIPYIWLGPIITFAIMCFLYAVSGIYPFGNVTTAFGDGMAQYVPFLAELTEKIKNGGSLLFTWHAGNGTNFWSIISYYLASPFNLIALFFDESQMTDAFSLITLIKPVVASLTFSIYLKNVYKKNDVSVAIFSVLWSFSAFIIGTVCFATWLDAIIYFPLVIMGLKNLMDGKSAWMYSLFLGLTIISNFYIAWMICIFCVIYFVYLILSDDEVVYEGVGINTAENSDDGDEENGDGVNIFEIFKNSYLLKSFFKFALSSLLAGGISAVFSIPTFLTLQNTVKGTIEDADPINISDFWAVLASHIYPAKDVHVTFNTFNYIFCFAGIISVILCVAFFFTKGVSTKKKVGNAFLLGVMWLSYAVHTVSYFWHGFGEPAGLAYRFSFIYSFVILKIAYETFINIKDTKTIGIVLGSVLSVVCVFGLKFSTTLSEDFFSWKLAAVLLIMILIFTVLLVLKKLGKMKKAITWIILVCVTVETVGLNYTSFNSNNMQGVMAESTVVQKAENLLQDGEFLTFAENSDDFDEMLMHGMLFGYNSTELYSSMADGNYSIAISDLGTYGNRMNAQDGAKEQTPIFNLLFPNKYYLDGTGNLSESWFRTKIGSDDTYTLYQNNYTMPFMYTVDSGITNWTPFSFFDMSNNQKDVFKLLTGTDEDAVVRNKVGKFTYENCEYISNNDRIESNLQQAGQNVQEGYEGVYNYLEENMLRISCRILDQTKAAYVSFETVAQDDGILYIYVDTSEFAQMTVTVDGEERSYDIHGKGDCRLYEIGEVTKGQTVTFKIGGYYQNDLTNGNVYKFSTTVFAAIPYVVCKDAFEKGYEKLDAMSDTEMLEFSDTYVKTKLTSYTDGMLYIPTAYDEGWTILIDGVETELYEHESHILMVPINEGEHIVEMKYSPKGFMTGVVVTATSVVILLVWVIVATKRRKKALSVETLDKSSEE